MHIISTLAENGFQFWHAACEDTWLHSPKFLCLLELIDSMHVPYSMPNSQVPSYNDISQCTMCNYVATRINALHVLTH